MLSSDTSVVKLPSVIDVYKRQLQDDQLKLCQAVIDVLIEAGMIFAYFKDLAKFIVIPGNILDKEIIEYHGNKEIRPYLRLRILPEEEEYHYEDCLLYTSPVVFPVL